MKKDAIAGVNHQNSFNSRWSFILRLPLARLAALGSVVLAAAVGCQTQTSQFNEISEQATTNSQTIILREGDVLKISFPGAPDKELNTMQQIRRDGKIDLRLIGEIEVAGMAPAELEKELVKRYSDKLVSKEVTVTVEASSFPVFVTGAVIKPGKILSSRPITALEAIMEAGGFDYANANLKKVKVIRHEGGRVKNFTLNMKLAMTAPSEPFYLKPSDIVYVPERFVLF